MTLNEMIKNLKEQARDRASMTDPDDPDCVFARDAETLREAVKLLQKSQESAAARQHITRKEILEAAINCACGGRDVDHGSPENCFPVIAQFWEIYLQKRCVGAGANVHIGSEDVCAMMALLKIARLACGQKQSCPGMR